jgi:[acyl-carrier-protein] S-malonyltransferase
MPLNLHDRLHTTSFAFRGYNVTNLGRTAELLAHRAYGQLMKQWLERASAIHADVTGRRIDLTARVRAGEETSLETFSQDVAMIVGVEMAHLELLKQFFNVDYAQAYAGFGYSLGEIAALIASGVFQMEDALAPLLNLADDCAELARDVTMGIVFSRGPALDFDAVQRLCLELNAEGQGVIGISAYLSPNTVLLLGQGTTVSRFKRAMRTALTGPPHLRKNKDRWPPLHTPILWQRNISDRAAFMMHTIGGGFTAPRPKVLSLVTGKDSYNEINCRETMHRWIDHPQRLWDVVYETLRTGVEVVVHVGPQPNLVPATFRRLQENVASQLARGGGRFHLRAMSGMVRRPWLTALLPSRAALLRAPFIQQVILEDWLLEQEVP